MLLQEAERALDSGLAKIDEFLKKKQEDNKDDDEPALPLSICESQSGNFPDSAEPLTASGGEGFRRLRVNSRLPNQWLCTFMGDSIHRRTPCPSQTSFAPTP